MFELTDFLRIRIFKLILFCHWIDIILPCRLWTSAIGRDPACTAEQHTCLHANAHADPGEYGPHVGMFFSLSSGLCVDVHPSDGIGFYENIRAE